MCYYSCILFTCQDWKWGEFHSYCRYGNIWGRPCGVKFASKSLIESEECGICSKQNLICLRRQAKVGRYKRWERERALGQSDNDDEGEKLRRAIEELDDDTHELQVRRVQELVDKIHRSDHTAKKRKQEYDDEWWLENFQNVDTNTLDAPLTYVDSEESPSTTKVKCPYYLRHPLKHQKGACMGPGFDKIGRLKEHIERVHMKPLQCPRCWEDMPSSSVRDEHLRRASSCDINLQPEDDRVSAELLREIKCKKPFARATSLQQRWETLFKMMFPNDKTIPSPSLPNPTCTCKAQSSQINGQRSGALTRTEGALGIEHIQKLQYSLELELTKAVVLPLSISLELPKIIGRCIRDSLFSEISPSNILMLQASPSQPKFQARLDVELSRSYHPKEGRAECLALAIFMNVEREDGSPMSERMAQSMDDWGDGEGEEIVKQTEFLETASNSNDFVFWDIYSEISPAELASLDFSSFVYDSGFNEQP